MFYNHEKEQNGMIESMIYKIIVGLLACASLPTASMSAKTAALALGSLQSSAKSLYCTLNCLTNTG